MPLSLENSVHQSDSESDEDYVPPQDDKGGTLSLKYLPPCSSHSPDSDFEQSDNEDNQNEAIDEQGVNVDAEAKKRRVVTFNIIYLFFCFIFRGCDY